MKSSGVFELHEGFKGGCEKVEDDERSDHSRSQKTDENVAEVRSLEYSDRSLSIRAMSVQLNLDKETHALKGA
jgi:hypothetical protein